MSTHGFDERQIAARGKAAWIGFGTMMILGGINAACVADREPWGTVTQQYMATLMPALTLTCVYLIWNHAYYKRGMQPMGLVVAFSALTVFFVGAFAISRTPVWQSGHPGEGFAPLLLMLFFVTVVIATVLRSVLDRRDEAVDA